MTCYVTREQATQACKNLKRFYTGLSEYYSAWGFDIETNRGRRNILMSEPMEAFIARELSASFKNVVSDGRTGCADITFTDEKNQPREIECKLTSPHMSSGSIAFQTDYETLEKKGSLDYVYIIADADFEKFCFIYFSGLTLEDFRPLSPGARGKVQMYKHRGMKKATVLLGSAIDRNELQITKLQKLIKDETIKFTEKTDLIKKSIDSIRSSQVYERTKKINQIERAKNLFAEKINNINDKIIIKKEAKSSFSFTFEDPNAIA